MSDIFWVIVFFVGLFLFVLKFSTHAARARSFSCPNEKFPSDDREHEVGEWSPRLPTQEEYNEMARAEVEFRMKAEKMLKDVST
jgi:hypothetical protein